MLKRLDYYLGIACTQNEWKYLFGRHYPVLQPFLRCTAEHASMWFCLLHCCKLKVIPEGEGYTALSPDYEARPWLEENNIPPDELQLWEFSPTLFAHHLCDSVGLQADPKSMGQGILRLGTLSHFNNRLPAYLLTCVEKNYLLNAQAVSANHSESCLFYTPRYCPDTEVWLRQKQHGYFPLEDLLNGGTLEPSLAYQEALQSFTSSIPGCQPDAEVQEETDLSHQMAEGFDSIRRERVEDIVAIRDRQQTIEEMAESADEFVSGLVARIENQMDVRLFFLLRAKVEEEGRKRPLSYAEIGMKLDISKQAVGVRVAKFKERYPEAWAFLDSVRNPKPDIPFSGLSPSERRRKGIDKAYNYDVD